MLDDGGEGWGAPCDPKPDVPVILQGTHGTTTAMAYVFGVWAVHPALPINTVPGWTPDPTSWTVAHVPTGKGMPWSCGLDFWDAVRVARALDDTGIFPDADVPSDYCAEWFIVEAAVAAALYDQYVWPLSAWEPSS